MTGRAGSRPTAGADESSGHVLGPRALLALFVGLQLAQMMGALDGTIVATALPTISGDLGGFSRITWVVTAYALASVASMPIYGKLGDLYGRKRTLMAAITIFLVASVLCAAARTLEQLLFARFAQGLGAGGLGALSMAVLADVVPARNLGRWMSYQGVMYAASSIAGPLVGGLFVDHLSWRWAFLVNIPVGSVALALVATHLPGSARRIRHSIDWLGSLLAVGALSAAMTVATLGPASLGWGTAAALCAAAVGLSLLFVRRERTAPEPVLRLSLLRDPVVRISTALNMTSGVLIWCGIFFVPLFVQEVSGVSPTTAGFALMPLMFGAASGTLLAGAAVERTGRIRSWPIAGSVMMSAGMVLLATLGLSTPVVVVALWALLLGLGIGFVMQPSLLAAQNAAPRGDLGVVTSTVLLCRQLGSTIGVAAFGGILNAALVGRERDAAGFAGALPLVFAAGVPVAVASILVAVRLRDRPLRESVLAPDDPEESTETCIPATTQH